HALCGELLPSVDRVHRISIVPRGRALGYTLNLPEEDRYLKTREELIDFMTMLLGGRAAEQLVFGSITTGASDDLKRVSDIARAMVHEYAMGTSSGSLRAVDDGASEATRRMRDTEVRELADEGLRAAQKLLDTHRVQLDELASTLLANEVLERGDIDRIMGNVPRVGTSRMGELSVAAATAVNPAAPQPRRHK
ncbi:MAG: ATP-dependent zinc metalloprotease FtsH, partial [Solirubrobacteraceae bacterium]